nr:hypothetical protein L203_04809 [Cryptococcus depauperatus CBS 7841]
MPGNDTPSRERPSCFFLFLSNIMVVLCPRRAEDPEREPLFPPETILHQPRPHPQLPNLASTSMSRLPSGLSSPAKSSGLYGRDGQSEARRAEGRQRMESIRGAFANRMQVVEQHSTPQTSPLYTITSAYYPSDIPAIAGTLPNRPYAPHLGRSHSEPGSLQNLGGFAAHPGPYGSLFVDRDRGRGVSDSGRWRSSTVGARHASFSGDEDEARGRCRGFASGPILGLAIGDHGREEPSRSSSGLSRSHSKASQSASSGEPSPNLSPEPSRASSLQPSQHEHYAPDRNLTDPEAIFEQDVIRRKLGIGGMGMGSLRRGRGRGGSKKSRGARLSPS